MRGKNFLFLIAAYLAGAFFAVFDTATNNIDVAPVDAGLDFLITNLCENIDFLKIVLYGIISSFVCFLMLLLFNLIFKFLK